MSFSDFETRIKAQFPDNWESFLTSLGNEPITSIRYNPRKNEHLTHGDIPWTYYGNYLDRRPQFTFDPAFHQGKYYVQESSSMFIDWVLRQVKEHITLDRVLDLCAAPGGKSTLILDHLDQHQFLIANEIMAQRNLVLRENLTKWGYPNFLITENKPQDFKSTKDYFDCILLDAPCSGEGLFRKDKKSRLEWSQGVASMCSQRQEEIFKSVWDSLKDGGILIYSTCTYNSEENELLLEKLLQENFKFESIPIRIDDDWNIDVVKTENIIGYRFLPHRVKGEGFFCSVLRKKGVYRANVPSTTRDYIQPWLTEYVEMKELTKCSTYKFKKSLFLAPSHLLDELPTLSKNLYIKQIGIEVAQYRGENLEPQQGLAMISTHKKGFSLCDVDREQALAYISHKDFQIQLSEGFHLLLFEDYPLGFVKVEKSKPINLYPHNWKIRTQQTTE